ncbi:MAG: hypothetical protein ACK559_19550, partial [bacterium]
VFTFLRKNLSLAARTQRAHQPRDLVVQLFFGRAVLQQKVDHGLSEADACGSHHARRLSAGHREVLRDVGVRGAADEVLLEHVPVRLEAFLDASVARGACGAAHHRCGPDAVELLGGATRVGDWFKRSLVREGSNPLGLPSAGLLLQEEEEPVDQPTAQGQSAVDPFLEIARLRQARREESRHEIL